MLFWQRTLRTWIVGGFIGAGAALIADGQGLSSNTVLGILVLSTVAGAGAWRRWGR